MLMAVGVGVVVIMAVVVAVVMPVVMFMIVVMLIQCQGTFGAKAEKRAVFRRVGHHARGAFAADMAVEANHPVRGGHDHMQIMADHQDRGACVLPHSLDQAVEGRLTGLVKALGRLIKDEELWGGEKGARQKHALELTAGEGGHLALCHTLNPDAGQNFRGGGIVDPHRERQEAPDRYGHRPIHRELLRHIAKPQAGSASDGPVRQWDNAQKRADQRGFARAVRAKNGDNLSGADGEGHVVQDLGPAKADADTVGRNQG